MDQVHPSVLLHIYVHWLDVKYRWFHFFFFFQIKSWVNSLWNHRLLQLQLQVFWGYVSTCSAHQKTESFTHSSLQKSSNSVTLCLSLCSGSLSCWMVTMGHLAACPISALFVLPVGVGGRVYPSRFAFNFQMMDWTALPELFKAWGIFL